MGYFLHNHEIMDSCIDFPPKEEILFLVLYTLVYLLPQFVTLGSSSRVRELPITYLFTAQFWNLI